MPGQTSFRKERNIDAAAVKASVSLLATAQSYGLKLKREGREWRGLSPFKAERTPSFYIDEGKGLFNCFASGEGGDVIRFVQLMDACDFRTALTRLTGEAGLDDLRERKRRAELYRQRTVSEEEARAEKSVHHIRIASGIWREAQAARGSLAERYLEARNIDLDAIERAYGYRVPSSLRFHPKVQYWTPEEQSDHPAMVGIAWREIRGYKHISGVHRTYLSADGLGKADVDQPKKTLGHLMGAMTLLSPVCETAVLGEGYETTLSVMAHLARAGRKVCGVSGLFLTNITGAGLRIPHSPRGEISVDPDPERPGLALPEGVREVILLKDADGKRLDDIERFMRRAATKFQRMGLRVYLASPWLGSDFNDMEEAA